MPIQNDKKRKGSALILVVIVTVLLCVIGIMFVMTMRIREMTTANAADDRDLDTAVGAVTGKIGTVLLQDLFGTDLKSGILSTHSANSYGTDPWLASLEPDPATWNWPFITDLSNGKVSPFAGWNKAAVIVADYQTASTIQAGYPADADGDGVADSMWIQLADYSKIPPVPTISTSRGKPVFAAVRIIDNCAMLNLNTAYCFYHNTTDPNSPFAKPWYMNSIAAGNTPPIPYGDNPTVLGQKYYYRDGGKYLSELNYLPMLRGSDLNAIFATLDGAGATGDNWYGILGIRKFDNKPLSSPAVPYTPQEVHELGIMQIENSGPTFSAFDISDELEIRNRFIMTSLAESRFERHDAANYTLDSGGGVYAALRIPRTNTTDSDGVPNFTKWKWRMDAANFDLWRADGSLKVSGNPDYNDSYKYDRRHVSTFYSFDRNIRSGDYWLLDTPIATYRKANPATADAMEKVFHPLKNQPIDLRAMTDSTKLDNIVTPDAAGSNLIECHRNILHLLYAFREREYRALIMGGGGTDPNALIMAARKAARQVANIIDYMDDDTIGSTGPFGMAASSMDAAYGLQINDKPTYINEAIIDAMLAEVSLADSKGALIVTPAWLTSNGFDVPGQPAGFGLPAGEVVYGYERQPFISEVYCNNPGSGVTDFAVELVNPYDQDIDLAGWNVKVGTQDNVIAAVGSYVVPAGSSMSPGRLTIYAGTVSITGTGKSVSRTGFGIGTPSPMTGLGNLLRLQRPDPAHSGKYLSVDSITEAQRIFLSGTNNPPAKPMDTSRKDTAWGFVNNLAYPVTGATVTSVAPSLGDVNNGVASVSQKGYQLPVSNDPSVPLDRLADFQKITWVDPNGLTGQIAAAFTTSGEGKIRYDSQVDMELLHYVCTLGRQEKGIPGRININTAPLYVIAAAIPPQLVMSAGDPNTPLTLAQDIVSHRPYAGLEGLLDIPAMSKFALKAGLVGDKSIEGDLEKRDWIFNRLTNIFTVRSDTFTAYILVRLGTDGPQRRMIAIFDRSNCWTAEDKPRLVALHPVPDPR